jgi:hypothetical protein
VREVEAARLRDRYLLVTCHLCQRGLEKLA